MALSVLSGAAIEQANANNRKHIHVSFDAVAGSAGVVEVEFAKLKAELGLEDATEIVICDDEKIKSYAAIVDHNGSVVEWKTATVTTAKATASVPAKFTVEGAETGSAVKLDFYVVLKDKASQITIAPDSFGGYFYVEADTLFRDQDGRDLAATLTFPKVKIQSNFTISMAPNGDPTTYDFVMDAMPAYTYFDNTKKVVCDMVIVGAGAAEASTVTHGPAHTDEK